MQTLINLLNKKTNLSPQAITNILKLLDEGATIPFIARYRKEMTGAASDDVLRDFYEVYLSAKRVLDRKEERVSKNIFYGVPLSTQIKQGSFFFTFTFLDKESNALLVQGRLYDSKRLENKIGMIKSDDFKELKEKLGELLNV